MTRDGILLLGITISLLGLFAPTGSSSAPGERASLSAPVYAKPFHPLRSRLSVIDGDSLGYMTRAGKIEYRVYGIDTPEIHVKCEAERGRRAKARMEQLLSSGRVIVRRITNKRDKYGRILATIEVGGKDVGQVLVAEGLAKSYFGGGKVAWC